MPTLPLFIEGVRQSREGVPNEVRRKSNTKQKDYALRL